MARADRFRIAYVGGGSRFVVTLLHGLAGQAEQLRSLGSPRRPIELVLLDPDAGRAGEMARYAEIAAAQTGLPIRPTVTADQAAALQGADWVIFSIGMHRQEQEAIQRFGRRLPRGIHGETGPMTAIVAAAVWPTLRRIGRDMQRLCPHALFSTLVNPTDVLAAAVERSFGIRSIGLCVEVGGLIGFLAYYLGVPAAAIQLEHIGVNHVGWVSRWTVGGQDGDPIFRDRIPARLGAADWYPQCHLLVGLHRTLGYLRSSAYHVWPFDRPWTDADHEQLNRWLATCLPGWPSKSAYRQAMLEAALRDGRMMPDPDGTKVHPEAAPYTYPDTRHVLGAVAAGLAGGQGGPVALQVPNRGTNPTMPPNAWIEVPAAVRAGVLFPQTVPVVPQWLIGQTALIAEQRACLADWLATGDDGRGGGPKALAQALVTMGDAAHADALLDLAAELPAALAE